MNPLLRPWRQVFYFSDRATRTEYLGGTYTTRLLPGFTLTLAPHM